MTLDKWVIGWVPWGRRRFVPVEVGETLLWMNSKYLKKEGQI